jgi:hypothetical protein
MKNAEGACFWTGNHDFFILHSSFFLGQLAAGDRFARSFAPSKGTVRLLDDPAVGLESRPGLAPGKGRVAAVRLDGFGIRLMNGASGRSCTCIGRFTGPVLGLFQARWQQWHSRRGRA